MECNEKNSCLISKKYCQDDVPTLKNDDDISDVKTSNLCGN